MSIDNTSSEPSVVSTTAGSEDRIGAIFFTQKRVASENSPIHLVRSTVSIEDDPSTPTFTFRVWVLGLGLNCIISAINQYFYFRTFPFVVSSIVATVIAYPGGKLLELILPKYCYKLGEFRFYLNPGPFNIKEHGLILVLVSPASNWAYGMLFVTSTRLQWDIDLGNVGSTIVILFTQLLGLGLGGSLRRLVVQPANMFWPTSLVSIALLRSLHDSGRGRFRVFGIVSLLAFLFYWIPGYFVQILVSLPVLCYIFPNNVLSSQLGGPLKGLGIGTISLDWATITSNLGSPLVTPFSVACNIMAGFVLVVWVVVPIGYYYDALGARSLPIMGYGHYDSSGGSYDVTQVVDPITGTLDLKAYQEYGAPRLTWMIAVAYSAGFGSLGAALPYVLLHHGSALLEMVQSPTFQQPDIHTKLMASYKPIPRWWFWATTAISLVAGVIFVELVPDVQLGWFGVLLASLLGYLFSIPNAILYAITSQFVPIHIFSELVGGLTFPGLAVGNMLFKTIAFLACYQSLFLLYNLKLGHYLKLPPRATYVALICGTIVSGIVNVLVADYIMDTIPGICNEQDSHHPSLWSCENPKVFQQAAVLWGLIGPLRIFGPDTPYQPILFSFLVGFLAPFPIYILAKRFPQSNILSKINIPILLGGVAMLPPAYPFQYPSWFVIAVIFNVFVFRKRFTWWLRYNYPTSAGLDMGTTLAFFVIYLLFSMGYQIDWWGNDISSMCAIDESLKN